MRAPIMGRLQIDNIEDRVVAGIEAEARVQGRSFEDQVRTILSSHAILTREERLRLVDEIRAMTPKGIAQTDSALLAGTQRDACIDRD